MFVTTEWTTSNRKLCISIISNCSIVDWLVVSWNKRFFQEVNWMKDVHYTDCDREMLNLHDRPNTLSQKVAPSPKLFCNIFTVGQPV